jgi:hypothetical protein
MHETGPGRVVEGCRAELIGAAVRVLEAQNACIRRHQFLSHLAGLRNADAVQQNQRIRITTRQVDRADINGRTGLFADRLHQALRALVAWRLTSRSRKTRILQAKITLRPAEQNMCRSPFLCSLRGQRRSHIRNRRDKPSRRQHSLPERTVRNPRRHNQNCQDRLNTRTDTLKVLGQPRHAILQQQRPQQDSNVRCRKEQQLDRVVPFCGHLARIADRLQSVEREKTEEHDG